MTEIFLWLPLKSLIRFKRLSKRWYFLISHKNSCFRRNYLSTLSTRRKNRIVGGSDDDFNPAIMAGFFYQKPEYWRSYDRVRFLPTTTTTTSTQFKKYNILEGEGGGGEGGGTPAPAPAPAPAMEIINNNINPFSSLDESLDKFLSSCLHKDKDKDQDQDHAAAHRKIFTVASSNGFLLCSLESRYPETYYLVNPVTMEWVALPKLQTIESCVYVGFVCKGDYPSLDLVEYMIVRISWLERGIDLLFEIFPSGGDNEWSQYSCSCKSLVRFNFSGQQDTVVIVGSTTASTTNKEDNLLCTTNKVVG